MKQCGGRHGGEMGYYRDSGGGGGGNGGNGGGGSRGGGGSWQHREAHLAHFNGRHQPQLEAYRGRHVPQVNASVTGILFAVSVA